jgi:hypothetical protein
MDHYIYLNPSQPCWCGGFSVAYCTQCKQPLCVKHANNPYPRPQKPFGRETTESINAYTYFNVEDPSVHGIRIWVSLTASENVLAGYGERHVCRECYTADTHTEHARILQSLSLPQLEAMTLFEFAVFMLFSGYHFSVQAVQIAEALNLTSQRIIQGWLKIAKQEQVAPEMTVVTESQTKRKQSSSGEISGWQFVTENTDSFEGTDWRARCFMRVLITPDGDAYQLPKPIKGEDYAPCRIRDIPSPWPEDDPYPSDSMRSTNLMLFYGVTKRIAALRGITWQWQAPYYDGIPIFCH